MPVRATFRESFNAGYLDPLLYSRADLRKWRSAMKEATNVLTLPEGGFKRRPGQKWVATYAGTNLTRLVAFRVGFSTQFLLVFRSTSPSGVGSMDVYDTNDALLTTLVMPYTGLQLQQLDYTQEADTMIFCHENVAPYRMLRSVLSSQEIDDPAVTHGPLEVTNTSDKLLVRHKDHGLIENDEIGISGASACENVPATDINTSHQVEAITGAVTTDSLSCTAASQVVTATIGAHSFLEGERIEFKDLEPLRYEVVSDYLETVIPAAELNRKQTITAVTATTVSFEVATTVPTGRSTTGGGADGTWNAIDKYEVTVATTANATNIACGGSPTVWALSSLAPDETRKVALKNIPTFNFDDFQSPPPADEHQRLIFDQFADGDRYILEFNGNNNGQLQFDDDAEVNADRIAQFLNKAARTVGIDVQYDDPGSQVATAAAGHRVDYYDAKFLDDAGGKNWSPVVARIKNSTNGLFSVETIADGGSIAEDVWSATRGWPRSAVFHQRRLWLVSSADRPLSVWASKPEEFYDFETGEQQPNDAIANTGEFDPIRSIRVCSTGLHLITTGGVVDIVADRDTGGYQHPLNFKPGEEFGANSVPPVILSGLLCYVDNVGGAIRQVRFDEADRLVAADVSRFAKPLINSPVRLGTLRDANGDYLFVVNTDGTMAVMNLHIPERVLGWTKWTTDDSGTPYRDAAEMGGYLYVTVSRAGGVVMLEKCDPDYYTDSALQTTGASSSSWSGFDHLDGETVDVRGDEATMDQQTVASGALTTEVAEVAEPVTAVEAGIPFDVSVQPTPSRIGRKVRLVSATLDVYQSREFKVGGFDVVTRASNDLSNPPPLVDGRYKVPLRGVGQDKTTSISQRAPQPLTVRGLEVEVAA